MKFFAAWFAFWEGYAFAHFLGLQWALLYFAACALVALGVRVGRRLR